MTGTFYDADEKVIYVHFTYSDPSEIPPGAKHPFKIAVGSDERSSKIIRYAISAESENSGYECPRNALAHDSDGSGIHGRRLGPEKKAPPEDKLARLLTSECEA